MMRAAVIQFPGSNCDRDMAVAIRDITGADTSLVWHRESALPSGLDLIAIPGGFSYGDYLRSVWALDSLFRDRASSVA